MHTLIDIILIKREILKALMTLGFQKYALYIYYPHALNQMLNTKRNVPEIKKLAD